MSLMLLEKYNIFVDMTIVMSTRHSACHSCHQHVIIHKAAVELFIDRTTFFSTWSSWEENRFLIEPGPRLNNLMLILWIPRLYKTFPADLKINTCLNDAEILKISGKFHNLQLYFLQNLSISRHDCSIWNIPPNKCMKWTSDVLHKTRRHNKACNGLHAVWFPWIQIMCLCSLSYINSRCLRKPRLFQP